MKKNTLIFIFIFQITLSFSQDTIIYTPIGVFHTQYTPKTGAPRQGILMPETCGSIEIFPEYAEGLRFVSFFEYIIVLYHFSEVEKWEPNVEPPGANHQHNFGVFSTRSPKRPNPIGFSVIKLDSIRNNFLYISGVDAFDGTPVLDIKPYLPSVDNVKSLINELLEVEFGHHNEKFINDSTFFK